MLRVIAPVLAPPIAPHRRHRVRAVSGISSRGSSAWAIAMASTAMTLAYPCYAQTYMCPPAPVGALNLPGPPAFAKQPEVLAHAPDRDLPDGYGQELDDPRWDSSWREDLGKGSLPEGAVRAMQD